MTYVCLACVWCTVSSFCVPFGLDVPCVLEDEGAVPLGDPALMAVMERGFGWLMKWSDGGSGIGGVRRSGDWRVTPVPPFPTPSHLPPHQHPTSTASCLCTLQIAPTCHYVVIRFCDPPCYPGVITMSAISSYCLVVFLCAVKTVFMLTKRNCCLSHSLWRRYVSLWGRDWGDNTHLFFNLARPNW